MAVARCVLQLLTTSSCSRYVRVKIMLILVTTSSALPYRVNRQSGLLHLPKYFMKFAYINLDPIDYQSKECLYEPRLIRTSPLSQDCSTNFCEVINTGHYCSIVYEVIISRLSSVYIQSLDSLFNNQRRTERRSRGTALRHELEQHQRSAFFSSVVWKLISSRTRQG